MSPLTHVDSQLSQIRVKLTREPKAGSNTRHDDRNKVVQITISGCRQLECPEADVVKGLVIDAESLIRVFDKLMNGERCVIGLIIDHVISK